MKKLISSLSIMVLLFSGYAYAEQDKQAVEVCTERAKDNGVSSDKLNETIDKCVQYIADDKKREQMELK